MKRQPPADLTALCSDLGIGVKQRGSLAKKYGDDLASVLQKWWIESRDRHRFVARGLDYVEEPYYAMQDEEYGAEPEAVSADVQRDQSRRARLKDAQRRQSEQAEQEARRNFRSLTGQVKEVGVTMLRSGMDPAPFLAEVQRVVQSQKATLDEAA